MSSEYDAKLPCAECGEPLKIVERWGRRIVRHKSPSATPHLPLLYINPPRLGGGIRK